MALSKTVEDQMAYSLCFFTKPLIRSIGGSAVVLIFIGIWSFGFGFLSILLTSSVLILSSLYITIFSKQKPLLVEEVEEIISPQKESSPHMAGQVVAKQPVEMESLNNMKEAKENGMTQIQESLVRVPFPLLQESLPQMENVVSNLETPDEDIVEQMKEVQESSMVQVHDYLARPLLDALSESESLCRSSTSEDSEVDWLFRDNVVQSSGCSEDGSISDEDSLIEIAIPTGHYVSSKEIDQSKLNLHHQKLPDFAADYMFNRNLVELLSETNEFVNEEENLIEIDISMGSIKCTRFEIEA